MLDEAAVRAALDADVDGGIVALGLSRGWPVRLDDGRHVFVSRRSDRTFLAGDFNGFVPEAMQVVRKNGSFAYAIAVKSGVVAGQGYKFVTAAQGGSFHADPNSRFYGFDGFGEISFVGGAAAIRRATLDGGRLYARFVGVDLADDEVLLPRTVRVLVPATTATHVLYVHDGQNVFVRDSGIPDAYQIPFGGWRLDEGTPAGLMIVAIDNTPERFFDYSHVPDFVLGADRGGGGDRYADFVVDTVRPLIDRVFGEPAVRGVMGSSMGGLISMHIVDRHPGVFDYAGCLSSTFDWGTLSNVGPDDGDDTLIDRVRGDGFTGTVVGLDSGGTPVDCADLDGDGIQDDVVGDVDDNYCVTLQMRDTLLGEGYILGQTLFYDHDRGLSGNGAEHREDAWAFRAATIHMPRFMSLRP